MSNPFHSICDETWENLPWKIPWIRVFRVVWMPWKVRTPVVMEIPRRAFAAQIDVPKCDLKAHEQSMNCLRDISVDSTFRECLERWLSQNSHRYRARCQQTRKIGRRPSTPPQCIPSMLQEYSWKISAKFRSQRFFSDGCPQSAFSIPREQTRMIIRRSSKPSSSIPSILQSKNKPSKTHI